MVPVAFQSEFAKTTAPPLTILCCPSPPLIALGLKCKSLAQHLLLSIIWILYTFPTSPLTSPLLFQPIKWLTRPPVSCSLMIYYLCMMPCPLSVMHFSFLPLFSSLTHTWTSGLYPSKSTLWLDSKFQFTSHLPSVCSSRDHSSWLSSYFH